MDFVGPATLPSQGTRYERPWSWDTAHASQNGATVAFQRDRVDALLATYDPQLVVDLLGPRALLDDDDVRADVHEMLMTRALSIAGGTTQILRNVVAEQILGLPR